MPTAATAATAAIVEAGAVNNINTTTSSKGDDDETSIVMNYLRKYGLVDAAKELQTLLATAINNNNNDNAVAGEDVRKRKRGSSANDNANNDNDINTPLLPHIDYDLSDWVDTTIATNPTATEAEKLAVSSSNIVPPPQQQQQQQQQQQPNSNINNTLAQATGGGYGYDLDAAPTIALWGVGCAPPLLSISRRSTTTTTSMGGGTGIGIDSELVYQGRELDKKLQSQPQQQQLSSTTANTVQATFAAKAKQSHWAAMFSTCSYVGG
jgi:hypothetical protein